MALSCVFRWNNKEWKIVFINYFVSYMHLPGLQTPIPSSLSGLQICLQRTAIPSTKHFTDLSHSIIDFLHQFMISLTVWKGFSLICFLQSKHSVYLSDSTKLLLVFMVLTHIFGPNLQPFWLQRDSYAYSMWLSCAKLYFSKCEQWCKERLGFCYGEPKHVVSHCPSKLGRSTLSSMPDWTPAPSSLS